MGSWNLEGFRMFVYVAFPIAMFHIFNNPTFFEESVVETRRKGMEYIDVNAKEELTKIKREFRKKREIDIERQLAELEGSRNQAL